jgi:hypothetical protein
MPASPRRSFGFENVLGVVENVDELGAGDPPVGSVDTGFAPAATDAQPGHLNP